MSMYVSQLIGIIFPFKMASLQPEGCYEEFNVVFVSSCAFEQAEKNVYLEERVQVLQQQNEDLKARIDNNVATSRSVDVDAYSMHYIFYCSLQASCQRWLFTCLIKLLYFL
jgi:hypothetical protein